MHAISHTLAHRAPPGSRTRVRWQPYNSLPNCTPSSSSSSKSSSPASYSTPATSISSPAPLCDKSDRSTNQNSLNCPTPELIRDASSSKNKFALGLVDQAVKTLCEVWRPQDIPLAFSNPRTTKAAASLPDLSSKLHAFRASCVLSSKSRLSPNASTTIVTASSLASIPTHTPPSSTAPPALLQTGTTSDLRNLVPLRGFVHEVLRRSRTSGCVLQTALCYLEAIRPKISELAHLERIGKGTNGEPETVPRIIKATEEEIERYRLEEARELELGNGEATIRFPNDEHDIDAMDTVRIEDDEHSYIDAVEVFGPSRTQPTETNQSMPVDSSSTIEETEQPSDRHACNTTSFLDDPALNPSANLPSPLLCPRRAFLAALILASKFTQDKCYSNRAWAKLTGLPAREIGRCERALGYALEWRLWVGKSASANAQASPNATPVVRSMARCQSEPTLAFSTAPAEPPKPTIASECSALLPEIASANAGSSGQGRTLGIRRTVRRASTLPAGSIANGDIVAQFTSVRQTESGYTSETTSSTLVTSPAAPSFQFTGDIQISSPSSPGHGRPRSAPSSTGTRTPSPDMPGLSYSPSSASSSSGSSSIGERTVQMNAFFDDCNAEYFNSPVARINTKLLVPGYGNGGSGFLGPCGLPTLLANNCKPHAVANGDYPSTQSPSGYGILGNGISTQIVVDLACDPPNSNGLGPFRFGFGSTLEPAPMSGSDGSHYERGF